MSESRIHAVKTDSCLFYRCPGPQTVSKSSDLQKTIRSCGLTGVCMYVSTSSVSYPIITSLIGVGFFYVNFYFLIF